MFFYRGKELFGVLMFLATFIIFGLMYTREDTKMYLERRYFERVTKPRTDLKFQNYEELGKLRDIIHRRIDYIQNPKSCETRKKLICELEYCGYGCTINTLTLCLIMGYETNRTVIAAEGDIFKPRLNFVIKNLSTTCMDVKTAERTIITGIDDNKDSDVLVYRLLRRKWIHKPILPEDLFEDIKKYHDEPFLWWTGVFTSYVTRSIETRKDDMILRTSLSNFKRPIVGIHVRRTDKKGEAEYYPLDEYMTHVDKWFRSRPNVAPRVYLATDEPAVLEEFQKKYPQYKVIYDVETINVTNDLGKRYTNVAQFGIFRDVYLLAKCDYVVCTLTSNVCRVVYQLMNAERGNVSRQAVTSLDSGWHLHGAYENDTYGFSAKMPHYQ